MKRILMTIAISSLLAISVNAQDKPAPDDAAPEDKTEAQGKKPAKKKPEKGERKGNDRAKIAKKRRAIGQVLRVLDTDLDRKISKEEFGADDAFAKLDADEDGFLTDQEMLANFELLQATMKKKAEEVAREEFDILDRDDNEKLTAAELGTDFAEYMKGDSDEDSELSFEEFLAGREKAEEARRQALRKKATDPATMMKALDVDGDGKISKDEAQRRIKSNFDKIDTNADGLIDLEELKAGLAKADKRERGDKAKRGQKNKGGKKNRKDGSPKKEAKPAPKDDSEGMAEDEF